MKLLSKDVSLKLKSYAGAQNIEQVAYTGEDLPVFC